MRALVRRDRGLESRLSKTPIWLRALCAMAWFVLLGAAPSGAATPTVPVPALACWPNAYQPVQPVTLDLLAPGDRLVAPGLILSGRR